MRLSRRVRHLALVALYQHDLVGGADAALLSESLEETPGSPAERRRGLEVAEAVWGVRESLDRELAALAAEWPLHRQPVLDRNILRLAAWEIRHAGTPGALAIDEAVELAKEYGTDRSAAFINGVLDRFWHDGAAAAKAATSPERE
jgi:N utilization substance protein B